MIALMELLVSDHVSSDIIEARRSTHLPIVGEVWFDCGDAAVACWASLSTLRGESLNEGFFLCDFDLLARCFEKLPSWYLRFDDENMLECDGEINGSTGNRSIRSRCR